MASEIEVVEEEDRRDAIHSGIGSAGGPPPSSTATSAATEEEALRNDVYTAAAYGDLEKLQRLVEAESCSVTEPDGGGYYALQWASLNNRTAAAQYIIEVLFFLFSFEFVLLVGLVLGTAISSNYLLFEFVGVREFRIFGIWTAWGRCECSGQHGADCSSLECSAWSHSGC